MAKDKITDYSTAAASNTDVGGVGIQGTNAISNVDNAVRELMSHLAETNAGTAPWADTMTIGDAADLTKEFRFEASGITAGQTRVLTVPDADGTLLTTTNLPFTAASASGPASLAFAEDTDNGAHAVTVKAPASVAANVDVTLPGVAGTLATLAGTETLAAKTLEHPIITGTIKEDVYTITDGAAFAIDPTNGSIQFITLGASRTPVAANWDDGESVTLRIADGTAYTITWSTVPVVWKDATAPTLATSGYTEVNLEKSGAVIRGVHVGDFAS